MLVKDAPRHVERQGAGKTVGFRIKAGAKAFEILGSGIYTNKPLAVIRELAANAYDAHVAAGCAARPFEVHLPNALEPHLAVRDYGPGLSPAQVDDVYTVYFESDKTDSNDYIGALGLGAKSPFSYVDSFQVTSWHAGVMTAYSIYKDADGLPAMTVLGEAESDAESGVEVRLPVERGDLPRFAEEARVLNYFEPAPVVSGSTFRPRPPRCLLQCAQPLEYSYEVPGVRRVTLAGAEEVEPARTVTGRFTYGLRDRSESDHHGGGTVVVMGQIPYPVDANALGYKYDHYARGSASSANARLNLMQQALTLRVEIGAVDMAATREALQYTPKTIAALKAILEQVDAHLVADYMKDVAARETLWDARVAYAALRARLAWRAGLPTATWRGREITERVDLQQSAGGPEAAWRLNFTRPQPHQRGDGCDKDVARHVDASKGLGAVYVDDGAKHGLFRPAFRHMDANGHKFAILVKPMTPEFVEAAGFGHLIVPISTLPTPAPRPRAVSVKREKTLLRAYDGLNGWTAEREVDAAAGGLYVETHCDRYVVRDDKGAEAEYPEANRLHGVCAAMDELDDRGVSRVLYGVRKADLKALLRQGPGRWVELRRAVRALLDAASPELRRAVALRAVSYTTRGWQDHLARCKFAAGSAYGRYNALRAEAKAAAGSARAGAYERLNAWAGRPKPEPAADYAGAHEAVTKAYPLLDLLTYPNAKDAAAMAAYIRLVDDATAAEAGAGRRRR